MKTTLNIDDDLIRAAKGKAAELGTTLTRFVEDALRAALAPRKPAKPYRFDWVIVKGDQPPDVDISDREALYAAMEADDDRRRYQHPDLRPPD